ncbi:trans-aconitate 2-methyltransferase [Pandoraea anhela]|uniref:Trans-aconitate 2-methyltransferase n=1 Tax=Pandoraea anhela TaxID=2508295 RepID=A0A5E4RJS2_9BURK|nr:trans-aconitate 2-methyltransferase [Pandoraea anhela]VVD62742.1 trans-aconitate 2-methyltransferase [Pandoraea anhela]
MQQNPASQASETSTKVAAAAPTNPAWQASQYVKFEDERTRPVRDLVAAIPELSGREATRVVDIGCGPGNSTEVLAARYAQAQVHGLDSSQDMVDAARKRLPQFHFDVADVATWSDGPFDVILANAVLQWLPDHETLYPRLIECLSPGGSLAVQTPDNLDEPAHRLMREVAADPRWADTLKGTERTARHGAAFYYPMLRKLCSRVDIWRTTYYHPLAGGAPAVVEWFKGSALRPFLSKLDDASREAFLSRYTDEIVKAYPALADGTVLLPFPRLFVVATR